MISKIREWTLPIMIIILVSFVIGTIFLNWGMNRGSGPSNMTVAGKINGREIPLNFFDKAVNEAKQTMERSGSPQDQYQYHLIPQQVWERQVNEFLMQGFYRKVNFSANADEIFNYLKNKPLPGIDTMPAFQTNGVFDTNKYIAFLNDPKTYEYNPGLRQLEVYARSEIVGIKLGMLLTAPLQPMRAEVEYEYKQQYDRGCFEYAYVKPNAVTIDSSRITDNAVSGYYNVHRDTFACDEQASLYVVKVAKKATKRDEDIYYQELMDIKKKCMELTDSGRITAFGEEARGFSDDESSASNGGDIGTFSRGTMMPEFDSVAFSLAPGTISDPVRTRSGLHIIFVLKREKKGKTEEVTARHILRKIVPTLETMDAYTEKIDSLRRTMQETGFVKAAEAAAKQDTDIRFDSTEFFQKGGLIPGIGYLSGAGRFIFTPETAGKETISERLENSDGFFLLAVKSRIPKGTLPLEAAKPRIRQILVDSMRMQLLGAYAREWAKNVGETAPLATLSKGDSLNIGSGVTDTVTRAGFIPGIGSGTKAAAVAFALPVGKRSGLVEQNGTFFLVRPLWKGPDQPLQPESPQASMVMMNYMQKLNQRIYYDWYVDYKNKAKIESYVDKIYMD